MSHHLIFKVLFQSDYASQDALMNAYRNEDYVAHYHEIHPVRPPSAFWPFGMIRQLWQAQAEQRKLRLATYRLGSMSAHLLADIGAGSFAIPAETEGRMADQLRLVKVQQAEAWDAMAAQSRAQKLPQQAVLEPSDAEAAVEPLVFRPRRPGPKVRNMAIGHAGVNAVPSA